jgi:hypothetical protein
LLDSLMRRARREPVDHRQRMPHCLAAIAIRDRGRSRLDEEVGCGPLGAVLAYLGLETIDAMITLVCPKLVGWLFRM